MKFIKGIVIGSMVGAGVAMMYADGMYTNKKRMLKNGKRWAKRMGIL